MSKKYFLTFGAPNKNFHEAVNRLCIQANNTNLFNNIDGLTEKDLMNDKKFWQTYGEFIKTNKRGYGYWIWKPHIIKKALEKMNDGDILLYMDCGCELNYLAKNKIEEYFELAKTKKILATISGHSECKYTKMDLIKFLQMENDVDLLKKTQYQTNCIIMCKCDDVVKIINEWHSICSEHHNLINDTPSNNKNFDEFVDHRHDQSVFSLLVKKYKYENINIDPTWTSNFNDVNTFITQTINWPFWVSRNKAGPSILDNIIKNSNITAS